MSLLEALWRTILVLAGTSLLTLVLLVIRRYIAELKGRRTARDWDAIKETLFSYLDGEEDDPKAIPTFSFSTKNTARDLAIHLADMIKGREKERLSRFLIKTGYLKKNLRRLRHPEVVQRREAAAALRLFDDEPVRRALHNRLLHDRADSVRLAAARSLMAQNDLPSPRVLAEVLGPEALQTLLARSIFRQIAREKPLDLARLLTEPKSSLELRMVCADALGESPDFRVIPYLAFATQYRHSQLQATALQSLGKLEHISAEKAVERGLADSNWTVRLQALVAAGRIGMHYQTEQIAGLLDDDNWWVRYRAAECLFRIGRRGKQALFERASGVDRGSRMAALILDEHGVQH